MNYLKQVSENIKRNKHFFTIIVVLATNIMAFHVFPQEALPGLLKRSWLLIYHYLLSLVTLALIALCFLIPLNPSRLLIKFWGHVVRLNDFLYVIDWSQLGLVLYLSFIGIINMFPCPGSHHFSSGVIFSYHMIWMGLGFSFFPFLLYLDYSVLKRIAIPLLLLSLALPIVKLGHFNLSLPEYLEWLTLSFGSRFAYLEIISASSVAYSAYIFSKSYIKVRSLLPLILLAASLFFIDGASSFVIIGVLVFNIMSMFLSRNRSHWNRIYSRLYASIFIFCFICATTALHFIGQAAGGFFGVGFLRSAQSGVLTSKNPSVFSHFIEEWGVLGGIFTLILFLLLILNGIRFSRLVDDCFGRMLYIGVLGVLVSQAFAYIMMTAGYLPSSALTLPFFSYGGAQFFIYMLLIWLLMNVRRQTMTVWLSYQQKNSQNLE